MHHMVDDSSREVVWIDVQVDYGPTKERVPARKISKGVFRLCISPILVMGIAKDDEIEFKEIDGSVNLIKRSGNVAIQIFYDRFGCDHDSLKGLCGDLGIATVDSFGEKAASMTVYPPCSLSSVAEKMDRFVNERTDLEWYFGNVFDPDDGVTLISWWNTPEFEGVTW